MPAPVAPAPLLGRRPALVLRMAVLALFLAFLVYATFFAQWRPHGIAEVKADILSFGHWAPLVTILLQGIGAVILVPGIVLVLATAIVFGLNGIWISLAGQTLGAILAYLIGRHVGRDPLLALLGQRLLAMEKALEHHGFRTLVYLRLAAVLPGPFLIYAPGLVRVPLRQVIAACIIGDIPFVIVLSIVGRQLSGIQKASELADPQYAVPIAFLVLLFASPVIIFTIYRARKARKRRAEAAAPAAPGAKPSTKSR